MNAAKASSPKSKARSQQSEIRNPQAEIAVACPFCNSSDTDMISLFGQQMLTSQYYCRNCRTGFEAVKRPNSKFKVESVIASEAKQSP